MEMYAEIILDYFRNPRNFGTLQNSQIKARDSNPLCGDVIEINANVKGEQISEILFSGKGCAISQASASMLTELVKHKNVEEAVAINKEELLSLLGIQLSPARLKCALLGLKVLKLGLYSYLGTKMSNEEHDELDGV